MSTKGRPVGLVRPGGPDDADAIARLLERVSVDSPFLGDYGLTPPPENLRRLLDPQELRICAMVATDYATGSVMGYAHAIEGTVRTMQHVATVAVAVDPAYRHRGVGLALLQGLVGQCRLRGWIRLRASIWATNQSSVGLFLKAGFVHEASIPEQLRDRDGRLTTEIVMGYRLIPAQHQKRETMSDAREQDNRRQAYRLPVKLGGWARISAADDGTRVRILDLSVGGCLIVGWTAPVGFRADAVLDLEDGKPPIRVGATVVRQTTINDESAAGVQFEEPLPVALENRLGRAIRDKERKRVGVRGIAKEGRPPHGS